MVSQTIDLSSYFVTGGDSAAVIDVSGWEKMSVQVVNPSGQLDFECTNDSGAVTGETDGNAATADNFVELFLTNISDGTGADSTTTDSIFKGEIAFDFFKISGTTITADKVLVFLIKTM